MAPVSRPAGRTGASAPAALPVDARGALSARSGAPPPPTHAPLADASTAPASGPPPADAHEARAGTEDRGSFTHGTCGDCGWSGPGRRARAVAARDAVRHLQTGCTGTVPTAAAHDHAAR